MQQHKKWKISERAEKSIDAGLAKTSSFHIFFFCIQKHISFALTDDILSLILLLLLLLSTSLQYIALVVRLQQHQLPPANEEKQKKKSDSQNRTIIYSKRNISRKHGR